MKTHTNKKKKKKKKTAEYEKEFEDDLIILKTSATGVFEVCKLKEHKFADRAIHFLQR